MVAARAAVHRRHDGAKRHRRNRRLPRRPRHRRPPARQRAAALSVTFIPKQINNPYFDAAKEGADKAATELGGTVTQVGPSAATEAQASYIQDATTKGVSAIAISANDPNAVVPALQAAKAAGIKIVGYDSSPAVGAYDVFVNQTDFSLIGQAMADWACDLAPSCTGEIAVLSAAATADQPERLDRDHEGRPGR